MQDIHSAVAQIKRPRLLGRAARIGAADYRRERHLRRLFGKSALPKSRQALLRLSELEAEINDQRVAGDATYSVIKHVDVLVALVGEAHLLSQRLAQTASKSKPTRRSLQLL